MNTRSTPPGSPEPARPPADAVVTEETIGDGEEMSAAPGEVLASETPDSAPPAENSDNKPKRTRGRNRGAERAAKRMARQRAQAEEQARLAREEADRLRRELDELRAQAGELRPPQRAEYETEDDYVDAVIAYREAKKQKTAAVPRPAPEPQTGPNAEEIQQWLADGAREHGEVFVQAQGVISDAAFPLSKPMLEYLVDSENGHALAMHLAKHKADAERLYRETPVGAAMEMQALEEVVLQEGKPAVPTPPEPEPPVKTRNERGQFTRSNAPPPTPAMQGAGGGQNQASMADRISEMETIDNADGTMDAYMAERYRQAGTRNPFSR